MDSGPRHPGFKSQPHTYLSVAFDDLLQPLCASISFSMKWAYNSIYFMAFLYRLSNMIFVKSLKQMEDTTSCYYFVNLGCGRKGESYIQCLMSGASHS